MSKRGGKNGFRLLALCLTAVVASAGWIAYWCVLSLSTPYQGYISPSCRVTIPSGYGAHDTARILQRHGIIPDATLFVWMLRWQGQQAQLKAGTYDFKVPLTMAAVAERLIRGRIASTQITFPEGWTASKMFRHLQQAGIGHYQEYMKLWRDPAPIADLSPQARSLEGYLFPDTYTFPIGTSEQSVIQTMITRFRTLAEPVLRTGKDVQGLSSSQLVTLASLVEKETGISDERPLVASVFYNRLKRDMKLQCDPTVIYAEWLAKGCWDGKINVSDLDRDSDYNTYFHRGLPPGPICNPGLAALKATANPPRTAYLYFVSMNNGHHLFSADYASHDRAVREFQRGR